MITQLRNITIFCTLILAACQVTGTPEPGVQIEFPPTGAIIHAETLTLSGQTSLSQFEIALVGPEANPIAQTAINGDSSDWQTDITHGYTGDPVEIEIQATANGEVLDSVFIVLAGSMPPPEDPLVTLVQPLPGSQIGGDMVQVAGLTARIDQIRVELRQPDGTVLSAQSHQVYNPHQSDIIPWTVDLPLADYRGNAEIVAYFDDDLSESVQIDIDDAAG